MNDAQPDVDLANALAEANRRLRIAYAELDEASRQWALAEQLGRKNGALQAELDACYREISELIARVEIQETVGGEGGHVPGMILVKEGGIQQGGGVVRRFANLYRRFLLRRKSNRLRRSGLFDGVWYLNTYPDVAAARMDPVEHYLLFGAGEGRQINSYLDLRQYVARNPEASGDPVGHLLSKRERV